MSRAFVTGATGFVGSAVVRSLLRRGTIVRALARPNGDRRNLEGLDVELVEIDLLDEDNLCRGLEGCESLYHVAALYSTSDTDGEMMYRTNVGGTRAILSAALRTGVQRVVHTSTIGTIGQPLDGSLATEDTPYNLWPGASHYSKSKYLGEVAALAMCNKGLPVVVVNPCAPVGPRDIKPSSTGQRIVDYMRGKMPSFISGEINFVSVDDVAEGHVLAAEKGRPGERYILGNREGNLSLAGFLTLMERVSSRPRPRPRSPSPLARLRLRSKGIGYSPLSLACDPAKAISELGLPQTPLITAFAAALAWFREYGYLARGA
jgi:dihydroflavonol-4-reductase